MLGQTSRYMNQLDAAFNHVTVAVEMARKVSNRRVLLYLLNLAGGFSVERGDAATGEAPLEEALDTADSLGNQRFRPYLLMNLARLRFMMGETTAAEKLLNDALYQSRDTDIRFIVPEFSVSGR
jgi:hypothetical protein